MTSGLPFHERKYKSVTEMIENIVKKENRSILKLGKNIKDELTNNYRLDTAESVINNEKREKI